MIGLVALYYTVRGTRTSLIVDVVSESNVMDVRTPLKDLSILFQGQDIQKENANLRILGVRLVNEGEANILESYFDSKIPWGLLIEDGQLIEARVTGSNSQYLSDNLHPKTADKNEVTFDKVIFDKGKYIALELLVLHNKSVEPKVRAIGKIAGMDSIPIRYSFRDRDQEGFKSKVFKGPIAVQIARTIAYFVIGFFSAAIVGLTIGAIGSIPSAIKKKARRKYARYLPKETSPEKEKKRQALLNIFIEEGLSGLKRTQRTLKSDNLLLKVLTHRLPELERGKDLPSNLNFRVHGVPGEGFVGFVEPSSFDLLVEAGLVRQDGKTVQVDPEAHELLSSLIGQLSEFDGNDEGQPSTQSKPEKDKE